MNRRAGWWSTSIACCLTLTGCRVGPDYNPPPLALPVEYATPRADATPPAIGDARDLARWWLGFRDPVLTDLIERALAENLDLELAAARLREARAEVGAAVAARYPHADLAASYERSRRSVNTPQSPAIFGDREQSLFRAGFDASWELDLSGGIARAVEAATADFGGIVEAHRAVRVTLVAEVARNYLELRGAQQRFEITTQNLASQRETLELVDTRFAGGLAPELDVARARAQVESTSALLPALDRSIAEFSHRLAVLVGQVPGALAAELARTQPIPLASPHVPVGLPPELLRRRPDLRRVERALAAETARIGVAVSDLYPKLSLTGSFGYQSERIKRLDSGASQYWSVRPALSWPILENGLLRARIAAQSARAEQALIAFEQAVLVALAEVENALVGYEREASRYGALAAAVAAHRRAVELATQLNERGLIDFFDVLAAQRDLLASEDLLVGSAEARQTWLVALYKALGGGWDLGSAQN
ncbi:MAG: efflux transporter outer membrane subunit [Planctomycetota bacterium]